MLRDRLLAACSGDEEQADMVMALLRRDYRLSRTEAAAVLAAVVPAEQLCERCRHRTDEDGFCSSCGWMTAHATKGDR